MPNKREAAFVRAKRSLELGENALAHRVLSRRYFSTIVYVSTKKEPRNALVELDKALALEPNNSDLLADRADVLPFAGRPEEALETIERSIELNPDHPDWYIRPYGVALLLNGQFDKAAQKLGPWVEKNKTNYSAYRSWYVAALSLSGRLAEAKELASEIANRSGTDSTTTIYAFLRRWPLPKKARELMRRGLKLAAFPEGPKFDQ